MSEKPEGRDARKAHVEALQEERRGYEVRGLKDRVAQVDAEIKRVKGSVTGRSTVKRETTEG